jgi:hypothetical protein
MLNIVSMGVIPSALDVGPPVLRDVVLAWTAIQDLTTGWFH